MKKSTFLHLIITVIIYCILSSVILLSDKKEPNRLTFDIAFPKANEEEPDNTPEEIESQVTYSPVNEANVYTQIFYTPKIITGIELWLRTTDDTSSIYTLAFFNPDGTLAHSQDFYTEDISSGGYTTIIFKDFKLAEGKQYNLVITPKFTNFSNLTLGLIPDNATWTNGLYDRTGLIEGTSICFNLIYDYQNWGFINWMTLTLICVFTLIYFTNKGIKQKRITKPKLTISALAIIVLVLITGFVIGYSKLII
ncbi:MAG: hypothetical protein J6A25_10465 [Lachnospiraceae bacterium]|nr:hypothetical protein [Lachnospiraceae bacterium]